MADAVALPLALVVLAATLAVAVMRPSLGAEALAGAVGGLLLIGVGAISLSRAGDALRAIGPTIGFLAALLLIAEGCRRAGLFLALGAAMARRSAGDRRRLLALVFMAASAVTIILGLDATVVLLPPIVIATAARLRAPVKGPLYACAHLANSASLLLPVSNLTNLLAFRASGISFTHFAALMVLPTCGAIAVEWIVLSHWAPAGGGGAAPAGWVAAWVRGGWSADGPEAGRAERSATNPAIPKRIWRAARAQRYRGDKSDSGSLDLSHSDRLARPGGQAGAGAGTPAAAEERAGVGGRAGVGARAGGERGAARAAGGEPPVPRYAVAVLALTLIGFALSSPLGIAPVWFAVAGAVAVNLPDLRDGGKAVRGLVGAAEPGFLIFVGGLAVIVAAAGQHGLARGIHDVLPAGGSLPDLLLTAAVSAVLANLVNNLPATLILVPVAAAFGTGPVLAVLVGVNIGPNLAPVGSLATLLWRRVLAADGIDYPAGEFVRLGLITVPVALLLTTVLLWASLQVV